MHAALVGRTPLLLFFYLGCAFHRLKVPFKFLQAADLGLTIYLLIGIGRHGGEGLTALPAQAMGRAGGFMFSGFCTIFVIGILTYMLLRRRRRAFSVHFLVVAIWCPALLIDARGCREHFVSSSMPPSRRRHPAPVRQAGDAAVGGQGVNVAAEVVRPARVES